MVHNSMYHIYTHCTVIDSTEVPRNVTELYDYGSLCLYSILPVMGQYVAPKSSFVIKTYSVFYMNGRSSSSTGYKYMFT